MASAWRNFKNILSRPLFNIIFSPKMVKFHPYSILTGCMTYEYVGYSLLMNIDHAPWCSKKFIQIVEFIPLKPCKVF